MNYDAGAMTLAESAYEYKTDVTLVFGNKRKEREYLLRTTLHTQGQWKTRNPKIGLSPLEDLPDKTIKEAAIVDREVWVYHINATLFQDLVAAVKLACAFYRVNAATIMQNTYAKTSTWRMSNH